MRILSPHPQWHAYSNKAMPNSAIPWAKDIQTITSPYNFLISFVNYYCVGEHDENWGRALTTPTCESRELYGADSLLPPLCVWVPGTERRSSRFWSKVPYPLSHLISSLSISQSYYESHPNTSSTQFYINNMIWEVKNKPDHHDRIINSRRIKWLGWARYSVLRRQRQSALHSETLSQKRESTH